MSNNIVSSPDSTDYDVSINTAEDKQSSAHGEYEPEEYNELVK
jgi:hypothetical protein